MPDINVWLALSWGNHQHSAAAWRWFRAGDTDEIGFCRFTQIGLLRLLTTKAVMGDDCLSVRRAWEVYDVWLRDPKVEMYAEPVGVEELFRHSTAPFRNLSSPKVFGDCYLLAVSRAVGAILVTLDHGLVRLARKNNHEAVLLS